MNKNRSATVQQNILYLKAIGRQMLTKRVLLKPCSDRFFANCIYKYEQTSGHLCNHRQQQKKPHLQTQPEEPQSREGAVDSRSCLTGQPTLEAA